jgi:hypothetical protein
MTERGEAVKIACVEVREELNRKVARNLGMDEARCWRPTWMPPQVCLGRSPGRVHNNRQPARRCRCIKEIPRKGPCGILNCGLDEGSGPDGWRLLQALRRS